MQKHPIIVVEGPDCTGKTTLALNLAKHMGAKYLHLTYRWPGKMHHYHQAAMELALRWAEHQPVVLDRWWPSEVVYAAAFRGGTPWPMASRMFERVALKHGILYVLSMPEDKQRYLEFYQKTKEATEDVLGPREKLFDLYEQWLKRHSHYTVRFDLFQNARDFYIKIADIATHQFQWTQYPIPPFITPDPWDRRSAGNFKGGQVLMIGDQSNPKSRRAAWPFFEHANSSLWLTQKLEELGLPEHKLMWINLHDSEGKLQLTVAELHKLHLSANCSVAMGGKVIDTLKRHGIRPTFEVNHPQYYRRFKPNTKELDFLGTLFKKDPEYGSAARHLGLVPRDERPDQQGQA